MYKRGDIVSFDKRGFFDSKSSMVIGIIISTLSNNGYVDVLQTDGVVSFRHVRELELVIESRRSDNVEVSRKTRP